MRANTINSQNIQFKSKIRDTNTIGFAVNSAINSGDKGFFNAIKHLANDGLNREIVLGGSNGATKKFVNANAYMKVDVFEYSLKSTKSKNQQPDAFQLLGENAIILIKKLAAETGLSKKLLNEKGATKELVKEGNELYRTVLIG